MNDIQFSIYPNPATQNYVKVKSESEISEISIYSMSGTLIRNLIASGNKIEYLDVSMLSPGIYIVSIKSDGKAYRQKLIRK
jgi:hypothetical protein